MPQRRWTALRGDCMVRMLRRPSLFFGWIVPLALLAGQLSTLAHSMAVAHDRCPEHGELVHHAARSPALDVETGGVAARGAQTAVIAVATAAGHGHEHCISFWSRRELAGPPPGPSVTLAPPPARAVLPFDAPALGERSALLSFAPKTSPPLPA
jgi:hypothetical protein